MRIEASNALKVISQIFNWISKFVWTDVDISCCTKNADKVGILSRDPCGSWH